MSIYGLEQVSVGIELAGTIRNLKLPSFKGKSNVFMLGATGVGKTNFRLSLDPRNSNKDMWETGRSGGIEPFRDISYTFEDENVLHMDFFDHSGDETVLQKRLESIKRIKPNVILFFIDHRDTRSDIPPELNDYDPKKIRAWEYENLDLVSTLQTNRIDEHKRHFRYLIDLIQTDKDIKKNTQLIVPIVTKYDLWKDYHHLADFENMFSEEINSLIILGRKVINMRPISSFERMGISEVMKDVFEFSGRKYLNIFTINKRRR